MKKLKAVARIILFLNRNIFYSFKLRTFKNAEFDNYALGPLKKKDVPKILDLYKEFNEGNELSLEKRLLLKFLGNKFCYILCSKSDEIFGFGLYYFNKKDINEKTIHEGYIGIKKEFRSKGIGTNARRTALEHFSRIPSLNGVSSRVSLDNIASLKGNIKLGFEIKEKYWDENENKERVYLVCDLDKYRKNKG